MSLFIHSNQNSRDAQSKLNETSRSLNTAFDRLSSGLHVNETKDDAASLSISTRFAAQINGLNQAIRNSNDGISLVQTAKNALTDIIHNLQRAHQLAVQSADETSHDKDRESFQAEFDQLKKDIDHIVHTTTFNHDKILDGSFSARELQVGAHVSQTMTVNIASALTNDLARHVHGELSIQSIDLSQRDQAVAALDVIDLALEDISSTHVHLETLQHELETSINNLSTTSENLSASRSRILDTNFAAETAQSSRNQIIQQAEVSILAQANQQPRVALALLE